jgi:conjugative relaxase-like TrwC/TraI family protein
MIRMIQSSSAGQAKAYFSDALVKSDYFVNDQELQGRFEGRIAERLGITGMASKESFFALCENKQPLTGQALTPRTKEERTTGYDINFHCPKSVSIIHALSKDNHIMELFQSSVRATMNDIEADAQTRVRKNGRYADRITGELIWADFTHQTARPVDDSAPDPQLHSHCFVFNVTWDEQEKRYKAGQFRDIKRDMPYYQALFHKRLSDKLIEAGYAIRKTANSFEIVGVPQKAIDLFSKRTDAIGQYAKENHITDAKQLSELGARTRSKKQKGLSMEELKESWREQIKALDNDPEPSENAPIRYAPHKEHAKDEAKDSIDYAIQHSFERASVMGERRLAETAIKHSLGNASLSVEDVLAEFKTDSRIIRVQERGRTVCTTKEVLSEEKAMVALARQGLGKMQPLYKQPPETSLKGQQGRAIDHILTTTHQVSIIRGAAGSGKTTLLKEAVKLIEQAGKKVTIVAPTAEASKGVLVEEGFKDANTVAKLLVDKKQQDALTHQVLWVDEAGLLGTRDMKALLTIAKEKKCRLILGGDTRQHASVVRGDALRILNTVAGIKTAEIDKIYRQKNVGYREAVEDLSKGNVKEAFDKLDGMGAIQKIDVAKPNEALVKDYISHIKNGKTALVVSPTHKQSDAVTDTIRHKLKAAGLIGKKEIEVLRLDNLKLTEAQKSDWRNYQAGQVVQFNQNVPEIKRGSVWKVKETEKNKVVLSNDDGQEKQLPFHKSNAYDVYEPTKMLLAKGDKVKITRNSFDEQEKRLNNGQTLEVIAVSKKGNITLRNKASKTNYSLSKDFGHLTHAHCITSYAAQGKTVDHVLIAQPASTFPATDAKQFYVSVSRGRESVTIYTDDKEALLDHASQLGDRQSAIELVEQKDIHLEHLQQLQKETYDQTIKQQPIKEIQSPTPFNHKDYEPEI